jgi:SAM-dependent methyltransferase
VPVHQHVTGGTVEEARAAARGDIALTFCRACGFTFNGVFDPARTRYSSGYDNSQDHSDAFRGYLDGLVADLTRRHPLAGKTVVEIGCGQGSFLDRLTSLAGCTGVGFDPSFDTASRLENGKMFFVQANYDPSHVRAAGDVVCARHVIEHISNPQQLFDDIRSAGTTPAKLWLETPRLEWIVERHAFWDIFYEHCSYFSMPTLAALVARNGWRVTRHQSTFGAQYQWIEGSTDSNGSNGSPTSIDAGATIERLGMALHSFGRSWVGWRTTWQDRLRRERAKGPWAVWGAGAKGVALLNDVDPHAELVRAAVDVNPRKQGRYVPGTGHPIVASRSLRSLGIRAILVANSNYLDEIGAIVKEEGAEVSLVPIEQDGDCAFEA